MRAKRATIVVLALLAACSESSVVAPDEAPIAARVRLLTDEQYANAVRDLLGDVAIPALRTPGTTAHQFIHDNLIAVDAPLLVQYRIAAETVAADVAARSLAVDVDPFAERAFRRPLADDERAELAGLAAQGGAALVVEAVLQSPDFLYRTELGGEPDASGVVELTPYELASELSFLLLDSIPDEPLWAAAADGSLAQPEVLAEHVDRLLGMPRVRDHLVAVVEDWLEVWKVLDVGKDPVLFPELDDALRREMLATTDRFVRDVLWERRGSLRELLTRQGGILAQPSVMTSLSTARSESIIRRSIFVHRHFLCTPELGRPPFDAIASVAAFTGKLTEQQFSHYRNAHMYCRGCHSVIDPPGRALHNYDGLGRWRDVDQIGQPIESTVKLEIDGEERWVSGPFELADALGGSEQVAACVVDQMAQHAFGEGFTDARGAATRQALRDRFDAADRDIVEVFRAIATSPAFRKRHRGGTP